LSAVQQRAAVPVLVEVYRDHMEFVWRTCRYLGVHPADCEDVVHEVFIVVKRRLPAYDRAHSMRSWLAGITRRKVLHYHRGRARTERKIAEAPPPAPDDGGPEKAVSRREAAAAVREFLAALDPDKRDVFVLCELEGLSAPEMAPVLGANVNTIYSRLRSARQAFERHVARLETTRRREGG
jgi:RNA polymerase sigma-70 factor (ECF subfamily)